MAQRVWTKVLQKFKVYWVIPQDINHFVTSDFMLRREKMTKLLWYLVIYAVLWTLWRERNQRVFEEKEESLANIIELINYWVALWASVHKDLNQISFTDWLRGWDFL